MDEGLNDTDIDDDIIPESVFLSAWNVLFTDEIVNTRKLYDKCVMGYFRKHPFRSIAWRINLKILPNKRADWIKTLRESRDFYEELKRRACVPDPHSSSYSDIDVMICNPLAIHADNPWFHMFESQSLIRLIQNDLDRTFLETNFFQKQKIQEMLCNILIAIACLNPERHYLQGMHEVLAPLLMVIIKDQRIYQRLKKLKLLRNFERTDFEFLEALNDDRFVEHDAFAMFEKVMEITGEWHGTALKQHKDNEECFDLKKQKIEVCTFNFEMFTGSDFEDDIEKRCRRRTNTRLSALEKKMNYLHFELLPKYDKTLAYKFEFFTDSFASYGFRFLPLMYVREFSILNGDLLYLWDTIFASYNGKEFVLIDYIFIAILLHLRHSFMNGGYVECLSLMSCNLDIKNVESLLKFALALWWPKQYKIPEEYRTNFGDAPFNGFRNAAKAVLYRFNISRQPSNTERSNSPNETNSIKNVLNKWGMFNRLRNSTSFPESQNSQQQQNSYYVENHNDYLFGSDCDRNSSRNEKYLQNVAENPDTNLAYKFFIEKSYELQMRHNELNQIANESIERLDKCIYYLCDTFLLLSNELKSMENELVKKKLMHQTSVYKKGKRRKSLRSKAEASSIVEPCSSTTDLNNSLITPNNDETVVVNDSDAKSIKNTSDLVNTTKVRKHSATTTSSFENEIEIGIEPDVPISSTSIYLPPTLLRLDMEDRRDRLINELVHIYAGLFKLTTAGECALLNSNSHQSSSESSTTKRSRSLNSSVADLSVSTSTTTTTKKPSFISVRHEQSTKPSKSDMQKRKRTENSISELTNFSTLRKRCDSQLPVEMVAAMALNATANARLKAPVKGVELKIRTGTQWSSDSIGQCQLRVAPSPSLDKFDRQRNQNHFTTGQSIIIIQLINCSKNIFDGFLNH